MKLAALTTDRMPLQIPFGDDVLNLVFDPMAYTIAFEQEIEAIAETQFQAKAVAVGIIALVKEWDLERDVPGGTEVVPLTEEGLAKIPISALLKVMIGIKDALRPTSEEGKDSDGGSPQTET